MFADGERPRERVNTCTCGNRRRSREEHSTLFGVIGLAWEQWPEQFHFQASDAEELRAWLAIEAGHAEALEAPNGLDDPAALVAIGKFFCAGKRHFRLGHAGKRIVIWRPLSMKEKELGVHEFRDMSAKIYEIIESITGVTVEAYKKHLQEKKQ